MSGVDCQSKTNQDCTTSTECTWTGTESSGKCGCNEASKYALWDSKCILCSDSTVELAAGKCQCKNERHEMQPSEGVAKCASNTCGAGYYNENDICVQCPDGFYRSDMNSKTCTKCEGDNPISSLTRDQCQTETKCLEGTNTKVSNGNQCVCQDGYMFGGTKEYSCITIREKCIDALADIWNVACITQSDCLKIKNAKIDENSRKCVCVAGTTPNSPNTYNKRESPGVGSDQLCNGTPTDPSSASPAAIVAVVLALLAVVVAATTAATVVVRARKARAVEVEALAAASV